MADPEVVQLDDEQIDETDFLDCVQITPEHIRANGTVHSTVFTGLAELIDNALDSQAREVRIQYCQAKVQPNGNDPCGNYIMVSDNGNGMSRIEALNTIMIGYSTKRGDIDTIGQFGNGLKSGSMRLGETLLLCTKQFHQYTVLLISLNYLDKIHTQKCFVPCISYEWKAGAQWEKIRLHNEVEKKHDQALRIILEYSPFCTEDQLKAHLQTITQTTGTIVLVANLKRLENTAYEMSVLGGDLVVNEQAGRKEAEKGKKKKGDDEEDGQKYTSFSDFLSQLYLHPAVAIYINDRKVNMRDPIRVLADPRWAYLDKGGFQGFLEREKKTIESEADKKHALVLEKTAQAQNIVVELSKVHADNRPDAAAEIKRLMRAQRMVNEELQLCKKSLSTVLTRKMDRNNKASTEIKVHLGMDLMRRCDPRVVFYTNGRRIMKLPLNKKGARFKKVMGVVCIIDIPSTLLPTSQNRENYATPTELNQLMGKIQKIAELYMEHAPNKYKSDAFWKDLGYEEKALAFDSASHNALEKVVRLTGLRRLCARCLQFRKVKITNVDVQTDTLDELDEPFECKSKQVVRGDAELFACDSKGCEPKTAADVQEETIKELRTTGRPTIYGESKAQDKTDAPAKKEAAEQPLHRRSGDIRPSSRTTRAARSPSPEETPPPRSTGRRAPQSIASSDSPPPSKVRLIYKEKLGEKPVLPAALAKIQKLGGAPPERRSRSPPAKRRTSTRATSSRAAPVERSSSPENTPSSRNSAQASTRKRVAAPPPSYIEDSEGTEENEETEDGVAQNGHQIDETMESEDNNMDASESAIAGDEEAEDRESQGGSERTESSEGNHMRAPKEEGEDQFRAFRKKSDALGGKKKDSTADAHEHHMTELEGYSKERLATLVASARMETETMTEVLHTLSRMLIGTSGEAKKKLVDELGTLHTSDNPQKLLSAIVNKRQK